jgi:hypothetical protein
VLLNEKGFCKERFFLKEERYGQIIRKFRMSDEATKQVLKIWEK